MDESDAESDVSITSVGSKKHDESFLAIEDEVDKSLIEIEDEADKSKTRRPTEKVAVIPDDTFCLENNVTTAPKALWVGLNLPKGWNTGNNVLTGWSLPEADLAALLDAEHAKSKSGEITLEDNKAEGQQSGNHGDKGSQMETVLDSAPGLEGQENSIFRGLDPAAGREGQITHPTEVQDTVGGQEDGNSEVAGGPSVDTWMEGQGAVRLDPVRPTHDTTGDVMRFQSEMRNQSERLAVMEKREQRLEKMIRSQSLMINSLQLKVQEVADKMESHPHIQAKPAIQGAEALPERRAPNPVTQNPVTQETRGARSRLPGAPETETTAASLPSETGRLAGERSGGGRDRQRADRGMDNQRTKTYNQGAASRATLKCNKCDHVTTNERRMNNHIRNIHTWTQQNKAPATLLVGDSHTRSINLREVEQCLGRSARLFMLGQPCRGKIELTAPPQTGQGLATLTTPSSKWCRSSLERGATPI